MKPEMFYIEISVWRPFGSANWVKLRRGIFDPQDVTNPLRLSERESGDEDIPKEVLEEFRRANPGIERAGEHQIRIGDATYGMIFLHEQKPV